MKKCNIGLLIATVLSLIFWSCSEENTSEPENKTLTCEITSPADSSVFNRGDSINVIVTAEDTDSEIFEVRFYLDDVTVTSDNVPPYEYMILADSLTNGGHKIKIIAKGDDGSESEESIDIGIAPVAPTNLEIDLWSYPITLTWANIDTDIDGFMIRRKIDEGLVTVFKNIHENMFVDSLFVKKGIRSILYEVTAYKEEFNSIKISDTIHVSSFAPSNLTFKQSGINSVNLSWYDNSFNEDKFIIERKLSNESDYVTVGVSEDNSSIGYVIWEDNNISLGETYDYKVYAVKGIYSTDYIEKSYTNVVPAPSNLGAYIPNETTSNLFWSDNSIGEVGFIIDRKTGDSGTWISNYASIDSNITTWTDTGLTIDTKYYYRIKAYFSSFNSSYSNEIMIRTHYKMIDVQGGIFEMGDRYNEGQDDEFPVHSVELSDFHIGACEVTNKEYCDMLNYAFKQGEIEVISEGFSLYVTNTSGISMPLFDLYQSSCQIGYNLNMFSVDVGKEGYPVYGVSWYGSIFYCNMLSRKNLLTELYDLSNWSCNWSEIGYRLPTEAEWEYAARGGIYWTDNYKYSGGDDIDTVAWYALNSGNKSHPVGVKLPNQLGLFDMSGNLNEWCWDNYGSSYYWICSSSGTVLNPCGVVRSDYRVYRGGSITDFPRDGCRTASRDYQSPSSSGFRVAWSY